MASGRQGKRRVPRTPPPVSARGPRRQASPKVLAIAGCVVVLAVVGIVLGVVLSGGKSSPKPIVVDFSAVSGIPEHRLVLGNQLARVRLTEYVDTSCPVCKGYVETTFPSVSSEFIRSGKVRLDARLIAFVGPSSERGRHLVLAAAKQNKAWQLMELLYRNQGNERDAWLTDSFARRVAAKVPGLDVDRLLSDADGTAVAEEAVQMDTQANTDRVQGTPTFILTTPDGQRHLLGSGDPGIDTFRQTLNRALNS